MDEILARLWQNITARTFWFAARSIASQEWCSLSELQCNNHRSNKQTTCDYATRSYRSVACTCSEESTYGTKDRVAGNYTAASEVLKPLDDAWVTAVNLLRWRAWRLTVTSKDVV